MAPSRFTLLLLAPAAFANVDPCNDGATYDKDAIISVGGDTHPCANVLSIVNPTAKTKEWCDGEYTEEDGHKTTNKLKMSQFNLAQCCSDEKNFCDAFVIEPCNDGATYNKNTLIQVGDNTVPCKDALMAVNPTAKTKEWCDARLTDEPDNTATNSYMMMQYQMPQCCSDGKTFCDGFTVDPCNDGATFNTDATIDFGDNTVTCAQALTMVNPAAKTKEWCDAQADTDDGDNLVSNSMVMAHYKVAQCCSDSKTFCDGLTMDVCNAGATFDGSHEIVSQEDDGSTSKTPCSHLLSFYVKNLEAKTQEWCSALTPIGDSTLPNTQILSHMMMAECCSDGQTFCDEFAIDPCNDGATFDGAATLVMPNDDNEDKGPETLSCKQAVTNLNIQAKTPEWCNADFPYDATVKNYQLLSHQKIGSCCSDGATFCDDLFVDFCTSEDKFQPDQSFSVEEMTYSCAQFKLMMGFTARTKGACAERVPSDGDEDPVTKGLFLEIYAAKACCSDGKTFCAEHLVSVNMCKSQDQFKADTVYTPPGDDLNDMSCAVRLAQLTTTLGEDPQATRAYCSAANPYDSTISFGSLLAMVSRECCTDKVSICVDFVDKPREISVSATLPGTVEDYDTPERKASLVSGFVQSQPANSPIVAGMVAVTLGSSRRLTARRLAGVLATYTVTVELGDVAGAESALKAVDSAALATNLKASLESAGVDVSAFPQDLALSEPEDTTACCEEETLACLACAAKTSVSEYCTANADALVCAEPEDEETDTTSTTADNKSADVASSAVARSIVAALWACAWWLQ